MSHHTESRRLGLLIDRYACRGCKRCQGVRACPTGALQDTPPRQPPRFDAALCQNCLDCAFACPYGGLLPGDVDV